MNQRNHPKSTKSVTTWLASPLISLSLLSSAYAESAPVTRVDPSARGRAAVEAGGANELSLMLPFLITSAERKRLAAELLDAIERGNLKGAESSLNAAIETGTLAIALINHLNDPNLLSSLQGLDLQSARRQTTAPAQCDAPATTVAANLAELQEALDREQAYSGTVSQTLTDLMGQYNALTARLETDASDTLVKVSELQNALQREQQQREALAHELASLQADYQTLQTAEEPNGTQKPPDTANLEALLQQERMRGDDAERQLASAREEVRNILALKEEELKDKEGAFAARIAELEGALSQARLKGEDLAQKLADSTEALHSLRTTNSEANNGKPIPLTSEFLPMRVEAFTLLLQETASTQTTPDTSSAAVSAAPRDDGLTPDDVTSALSTKGDALVEVAQLPEDALPLPVGIAPLAPAQTEPAPPPMVRSGSPLPANKPDDRMTVRADELFRKGDVSGARLLLERSVKSGNARAAFLLAETYDPHVLSKLGVLGIRGDANKAREFYAQAQALGMPQAMERLQALK